MLKLKDFRVKKGLKIKEVAQRMNVSRVTIWNYEKGKRKPSIDVLIKLANIYDCSVVDFL